MSYADQHNQPDQHDQHPVRSADYTHGMAVAAQHQFNSVPKPANWDRVYAASTPQFRDGYDAGMRQLTGGHSERYSKDEVLVHRETVEQLIDAIDRLSLHVDGPETYGVVLDVARDLNSILPNLKRALAIE